MEPTKIALTGIGKIATDQHIPALQHSDEWELAAVISRHVTLENMDLMPMSLVADVFLLGERKIVAPFYE